jgi:hypothetical protein
MIAQLILGCVLSGAAGFLAGWWKGARDHSADMQGDIDKLYDVVQGMRTACAACGTDYETMCPKGCASTVHKGADSHNKDEGRWAPGT